jgi:hypothetical protein
LFFEWFEYRIADIRFRPEGIYCELDGSESCGHIEFARNKRNNRKKRKEGWKLQEV